MLIPVKVADLEGSLTGISGTVDVLLACQQCL